MRKNWLILVAAAMLSVVMLTGCGGSDNGNYGTSSNTNSNTNNTNSTTSTNNAPINVISREDGSGTRGAFIELFGVEVKDGDTKRDMTTDEATIVSKTDVMMTSIAGDKNGIGYVSVGSLNDSIKALEIDGAVATSENIKNGSYTVSRPFMIATKGELQGLTKDFVDFILSAEGQEVVNNNKYVAVNDNAAPYTGSKQEGRLVIAGSSSVSPVMEKLVEAYKKIYPEAVIEIQTSDSTAGMTAAMEGTCNIGMASRALKDSEKEVLSDLAIAIDGIAVIVSKDNAVSGLSKEQVRLIFTGETTNWSEID